MQAKPRFPDPEETALKALGFLADSPEALDRFMAISGASQDDVRARALEPDFLAAVFDFLLSDEELARAFSEQENLEPQVLQWVQMKLSGA